MEMNEHAQQSSSVREQLWNLIHSSANVTANVTALTQTHTHAHTHVSSLHASGMNISGRQGHVLETFGGQMPVYTLKTNQF